MLSQAQREAHYTGIGSSTAPAVLGLDPYCSEYQAWRQIVDPSARPDLSANLRVRLGNLFEGPICDNAAAHWRLTTVSPNENHTFRHEREAWALAHPDRLVLGPSGSFSGAIEAKFRGSAMRQRYRDNDGAPLDTELVQCHWQILVCGFECVYLAVILGNEEERHWRIERNEAECEYLLNTIGEWWHTYVIGNRAPRVNTALDARAKWPHAIEGKRIEVDQRIAQTIGEYRKLKSYQRELADTQDALYAEIVDAAGDAEELEHDGELIATYREHERADLDVDALLAQHPTLAQQYQRKSSYRKLHLK